jgi:hypothetical protein
MIHGTSKPDTMLDNIIDEEIKKTQYAIASKQCVLDDLTTIKSAVKVAKAIKEDEPSQVTYWNLRIVPNVSKFYSGSAPIYEFKVPFNLGKRIFGRMLVGLVDGLNDRLSSYGCTTISDQSPEEDEEESKQ